MLKLDVARKMRDDFTKPTKRILAGRVAYKCCYPGCGHITIGPSADNGVANLGKAAHIHAAAPGGPRYLSEMTKEERTSLENAIWMCPTHADLIDTDHTNYAADTLRLWKAVAEKDAHRQLMNLDKRTVHYPTTLIWLDSGLIFEGIWKTADADIWTIVIKQFISGGIDELREFTTTYPDNPGMRRYIIIESQGDGRLLKEDFSWLLNAENEYEIKVHVFPKVVRIDPNNIGSGLADAEDGDILIENGDFKTISGKELALQIIRRNLSFPFGSWVSNPLLGSFFSLYFYEIRDKVMLNRFVKIEITRLITIPVYQYDPVVDPPELNFVNRILDVSVGPEDNGFVLLNLSLEWGDGTTWTGILRIRLTRNYAQIAMINPSDESKMFWKKYYAGQ